MNGLKHAKFMCEIDGANILPLVVQKYEVLTYVEPYSLKSLEYSLDQFDIIFRCGRKYSIFMQQLS